MIEVVMSGLHGLAEMESTLLPSSLAVPGIVAVCTHVCDLCLLPSEN